VIRARCEIELKDRVKKFSEANKITESDFVREAVEKYLAYIESGGARYMVNPFTKK
jgi:predicted DNA-binding protein